MTTKPSSGYSGTPLAKKLGFKEGSVVYARNAPGHYRDLLGPLPPGILFPRRVTDQVDIVHGFFLKVSDLELELARLRKMLAPHAAIWVSWPKKASKVATDITEDVIRSVALPLGFVDIKVCAVDETWSGLKLVVRKSLRES